HVGWRKNRCSSCRCAGLGPVSSYGRYSGTLAAIGPHEPDTARGAEAAMYLRACAVISARAVSARTIGDRPFPIDVRCAGKRYGYSDRHVHGKSVLRPVRDKNASAMEVCSQPGMASDSPGDVSNEMIKAQTAGVALG